MSEWESTPSGASVSQSDEPSTPIAGAPPRPSAEEEQLTHDLAELRISEDAREAVAEPEAPREGDEGRVGLVYDARMALHEAEGFHYERPQRVTEPWEELCSRGIAERCWCVTARMATDTELEGMHRESHIRVVEGELPHPENVNTNDFYTNEHTPSAARLSAGCCIAATKAAVNGMLDRAFALIRPPGHHAEPCEAMGFCFFNNVSLATVCALQDPDVNRILIVDWDVHHGNGTQNMFYDEPRVMYVSLHRKDKGFYPGTGAIKEVGKGKGKGYTVNIGWTGPEFGDADYLAAFSVVVEPLCEAFDPDLIIVSSGFDAAEGDPLGEMRVTPECYAHLTHRLMAFASGQVVMALEGGYNVDQVSECVCQCVQSLLGQEPPALEALELHKDTKRVLFAVAKALAPHWPTLEKSLVETRFDEYEKGLGGHQKLRTTPPSL